MLHHNFNRRLSRERKSSATTLSPARCSRANGQDTRCVLSPSSPSAQFAAVKYSRAPFNEPSEEMQLP